MGILAQDMEEKGRLHLQDLGQLLDQLEQVDVIEGLELQDLEKLKAFDKIQPALLVDAVYQLSMDNHVMPQPTHLCQEKVFFLPL